MIDIKAPFSDEDMEKLVCGDIIKLSGVIYTGRDAAHKRMCAALDEGKPRPFDIDGAVIYYVGPCPCADDKVIGSCGPTTSYRMDAYAPRLIRMGLRGMIGKGARNDEVKAAITDCGAVYFGAIGGAGALLAHHVVSSEVIAYEDLGTEAVRRLEVNDFPVTVVIDTKGNDLYRTGREKWKGQN